MSINYVIGNATNPPRVASAVIVHCCNDIGAWGRGFVLALSKRWKEPEHQYRVWASGDSSTKFALGEVQFVQVEAKPALWVANIIGQHGIRRRGGAPPVRYDAILQGLAAVGARASEYSATVHMPRIGCGLAGGTWDKIEAIVKHDRARYGVSQDIFH